MKKVLASVLAAAMAVSTIPLTFAAGEGTGPVQKEQNGGDIIYTGEYVSFSVDYQKFTFIQTEDDQKFTFTLDVGAKKNNGVNYGYVYWPEERTPQTLSTPIGKSFTTTWPSNTHDALPGTIFGGNDWVQKDCIVDFVGDGGKTYETALVMWYDGKSTSGGGSEYFTATIPLTVTVLDKRALNSAIEAANAAAADKDYYIDYLWQDVETALEAARKLAGDVVDTQTNIDNAANMLQAAVDALDYKEANYEQLNQAKTEAQEILETPDVDDLYTADTLRTLREKYEAAQKVPGDLDIKQQDQIDTAASALRSALDAMKKFADYTIMQSAITAFEKLNADYYDPVELANVKIAVDSARTEIQTAKKSEDEQADVTRRGMELLKKVSGLQMLPADYDALDRAVADGAELLASPEIGNYTPESVENLFNAVLAGQNVEKDLKINEQQKIDDLAQAIADATTNLQFKKPSYEKLDAAIKAANAALGKEDIGDYTESSVGSLKAQLTAAQGVRDDGELTIQDQEKVDAAADALNQAVSALVLKDADMSELNSAISRREEELNAAKEAGTYTEASIARLESAISTAKSVAAGSYTIKEQQIVDDAVTALNSVKLDRTEADYGPLEELIASKTAELEAAKDDDRVSEESKEALRKAIEAAQAVVDANYGPENQHLIDQAVEDLAAVKLDWDDADYTELNAAIEQANTIKAGEDYKYYTEISVEAFEAALTAANELDKDLDIRNQGLIDNTARVLQAAIKGLTFKDADFGALNEALKTRRAELVEATESGNYTQDSLEALKNAIDAAQEIANDDSLTAKDQEKINQAVKDLNAVQLILKDADYTDLDNAIEAADAIVSDPDTEALYTPDSIQTLKDRLGEAKAVERDLKITEQGKIDAAAQALTQALEGLQYKPADLTELQNAVKAAEAKLTAEDINNYTEDSRQALQEAVDAAKALIERKPNITEQELVNTTADQLNGMELVLKDADYSRLNALIAENEKKLEHPERYTEDSVEKMRAALAEAKKVVDAQYKITDQKKVDDAYDALAAVKLVELPADYSRLDAAIKAAEAKLKEDNSNYTEDSIRNLEEKLQAAKDIKRDQTSGYQDTIDAATEALTKAMDLTLKRADMNKLQKAVDAANAKLTAGDIGNYTEESVKALQAAVDAAQDLLDNPPAITEQTMVDQKADELNAMELVLKGANYDALNAAIANAEEQLKDTANYTDDSVQALKDAVAAAKEVVAAQYDITKQAVVDQAVKDLEAVKLVLKPADYTQLDQQIARAKELLADEDTGKLYTEESVQKLKDQLAAAEELGRDLKITDQKKVDDAAAALAAAVELQYRDADLSALQAAIDEANDRLNAENIADYTDDSVQALKDAVQKAQELLNSKPLITEQAEVDRMVETLQGMELVLKEKPDVPDDGGNNGGTGEDHNGAGNNGTGNGGSSDHNGSGSSNNGGNVSTGDAAFGAAAGAAALAAVAVVVLARKKREN